MWALDRYPRSTERILVFLMQFGLVQVGAFRIVSDTRVIFILIGWGGGPSLNISKDPPLICDTTDRYEASRGLFTTAELLVNCCLGKLVTECRETKFHAN